MGATPNNSTHACRDTGEGRETEQASVAEGSQALKVKSTRSRGKGKVGLSTLINNLEKVHTDSSRSQVLAPGEDDRGAARANKRNGQ